jgi:hypothetical protein
MFEGYSNVMKKLSVGCEHITQCTTVADLLRNPTTLLRDLDMN